MPSPISPDTPQSQALLAAGACPPAAARVLGLLFANRDLDLIQHLASSTDLPNAEDFPSAEILANILAVEPRWAAFSLAKAQRFLHKRKMNGDFSPDIRTFSTCPDVLALAPNCRQIKKGLTAFIGDSLMATNHFGANAPFPILAGSFLQSLDVGPLLNAGIGGQTTKQGLERFQPDVLDHRPTRVVFSFGSNDLSNGVPIATICDNFQSMIAPAQSQGADIVLGLILPVITDRLWWSPKPPRNADLAPRRLLQSAMLALAHRHHIPCLDLLDRLTPDHYCVDGIHLNQSGQELCALETLRLLTSSIR